MSSARHSKRQSQTDGGFGYQLVGQPGLMSLDDKEAPIVSRIFDLCVAGGGCLKFIRDSIESEVGIVISIRNLYDILRDYRYLGLISSDGLPHLRDDLAIVGLMTYTRVQQILGPVSSRRKECSETNEAECAWQGCCHQTNARVEPVSITEATPPTRPTNKCKCNVQTGRTL